MYRESRDLVARAIREETGGADPLLTDGEAHADLASTVAFSLAKKERRRPQEIAQELAATLGKRPDLMGILVEATGPYLNFTFGSDYLDRSIQAAVKPGYGSLPRREQRVVVEHTSANPNGPLHVGHIRNTIIGDSLARVLKKAGYRTETQYYVNDMGRQIAIVSWGVDRYGGGDPAVKGDDRIARQYIAANRELEADPALTSEIDRLMQQVEAGEPETVAKFRSAVSICKPRPDPGSSAPATSPPPAFPICWLPIGMR